MRIPTSVGVCCGPAERKRCKMAAMIKHTMPTGFDKVMGTAVDMRMTTHQSSPPRRVIGFMLHTIRSAMSSPFDAALIIS